MPVSLVWAKAVAAGYANPCMKFVLHWGSKEFGAAYCKEHALHAQEHAAHGDRALMESIWADPTCYRHKPGRRLAATGMSANSARKNPVAQNASSSSNAGQSAISMRGAGGRGKGAGGQAKGGGRQGKGGGPRGGSFRRRVARQ